MERDPGKFRRPLALAIAEIQGAGHTSQYVGQQVITTGIVTADQSAGAARTAPLSAQASFAPCTS